jgi:hypothetical protein
MARHIERVFDPRQPLVTRRFFVAAGRHYNPGDPFEWRRMAVDQRRVKLLFDAGKIMHSAADEAEPLIEVGGVGAILSTPAPTTEQEVEDAAILAAASAPVEEPQDDLADLTMKELRAIADAEGAPFRVSRDAQRAAIREHRHASAGE